MVQVPGLLPVKELGQFEIPPHRPLGNPQKLEDLRRGKPPDL
jgi:hypothetical protein